MNEDTDYICNYLGLPIREYIEGGGVFEVVFAGKKPRVLYNSHHPYSNAVYPWGTDLLYGLVRALTIE